MIFFQFFGSANFFRVSRERDVINKTLISHVTMRRRSADSSSMRAARDYSMNHSPAHLLMDLD